MFVLGHVGIGRLLVGARGRALPVVPFVVGAILPDLIDKPLYYSHVSDFVTCTRTFGHTGLLLGTIAAVAVVRRSPAWTAVALAMATHLLFDALLDLQSGGTGSTVIAVTWPFLSRSFSVFEMTSPIEHLFKITRIDILLTETLGALFLWREYLQKKSTRIGGGPHRGEARIG
jgi:hypothetical protein